MFVEVPLLQDLKDSVLQIGSTTIEPKILDGRLRSIGDIHIAGRRVRNPATRFCPWFDTFEGDVFRDFFFLSFEQRGATTVLRTKALSDPDALFRERRDSSGDPCFRNASWDAAPQEARLDICFEPAEAEIDGRKFTGFRYWFEYEGNLPIHRIVDRQTWEIGGNLDDVSICLRNWLTPPRMKITRETTYSTVGLDNWATLLPGNLWGRWSLLPGFDMQYGKSGILVGWFDQVSLIRTVVETNAGDDSLRVLDMHMFAQANKVTTNPKTILHCPDQLDAVDALNLWTWIQDRELERGQAQFGIPKEEPPGITFSLNVWKNVNFDTTYEEVIDVASEFGGDYVFIDVIFEHEEAYNEQLRAMIPPPQQQGTILQKRWGQNMCCVLDWKVNDVWGGEAGLKRLCDRAGAKGVKVLSWMSTHASPNSYLNDTTRPETKELARGAGGVFAGKESGRHPDTGYPASCWTFNMNTPVTEWLRDSLIGVCQRTGLAGYLWDSFSNLGWWQVDYSQGDMRPQFDRMAHLYAELAKAGLYIKPEALVSFSNHSCCGLHGGNVYADDLLGYSYNTVIALWFNEGQGHDSNYENRILRGQAPVNLLFECIAHKRIPSLNFHLVPREQWHAPSVSEIKEVLAIYKTQRHRMIRRTVLKDGLGVRWDGGDQPVLFAFKDAPAPAGARDAVTGESVSTIVPNHAYVLPAPANRTDNVLNETTCRSNG